jgi:hypothetical protein
VQEFVKSPAPALEASVTMLADGIAEAQVDLLDESAALDVTLAGIEDELVGWPVEYDPDEEAIWQQWVESL